MATVFETYDGPTGAPIEVEVITPAGDVVGYIGAYEVVDANLSIYEASTLTLTAPLDDVTATLLPCDGRVILSYRVGDLAWPFMPNDVEVVSHEDDPSIALVNITAAGGRAMLAGQRIPPGLTRPVEEWDTSTFHIEGNLESVVKQLITVGTLRMNHPLYVLSSLDRGPYVEAAGAWETTEELVTDLMTGTGMYLDMRGWLPGMPYPEIEPFAPTYFVDVKPYRDTDIVWSPLAGDVVDWSVKRTRAQANRVTVTYQYNDDSPVQYRTLDDGDHTVGWHHRELVEKFDYNYAAWEDEDVPPDAYRLDDQMYGAALKALAAHGPGMEIAATIDVANLWNFTADVDDPRGFNLGDRVALDLPVIGRQSAIVSGVDVKTTATEHTVTPRVTTPDVVSTDVFTQVARLANRVHQIEKRN